jgi:hypothetical protein
MYALALAATTFVGTFFWPASPEGAVALFVTQRGWFPLLVGLVAALGQVVAYLVLFLSGDQIRRRWPWFGRQCDRMRTKYASWLGKGAVPLACSSGLLGLPPSSTLVAVAPGLGLPARWLIPVLFVMRVARFTFVATVASRVLS